MPQARQKDMPPAWDLRKTPKGKGKGKKKTSSMGNDNAQKSYFLCIFTITSRRNFGGFQASGQAGIIPFELQKNPR